MPASIHAARAAALLVALVVTIVATSRPASAQLTACDNSPNSCFAPNPLVGGCNNAACCNLVCSVEPACCSAGWDELCVSLANKFCSDCGAVPDSCFAEHTTPSCSNGLVCEAVCAIDPTCCSTAWSADCVALAIVVTDDCGDLPAGSCLTVHENPNCADANCCNRVCAIDPNCCEITWDQTCVSWATEFCFLCGNERAGSCCYEHNTPHCNDRACCEAVCQIDPSCCSDRWDRSCVDLATAPNSVCNLPSCRCGNTTPIPGQNLSCKAVHTVAGCSDFVCCNAVCAIDGFCCEVSWDYTCTQLAASNCALSPSTPVNTLCNSSPTGGCFVQHDTPGCNDVACCAEVCTVDPSCCQTVWDLACASRARTLCNGCGNIEAGSCIFEHENPSCLDRVCCENVCNIDPFCCASTGTWDFSCVQIAFNPSVCADLIECGDVRTRSCFVPTSIPACKNGKCCQAVCEADPTCCSRAWDETCAQTALEFSRFVSACTQDFPAVCATATGSPLVVHGTPGCADRECCAAVCAVDPICCSFGWNQGCVNTARAVCFDLSDCPGPGGCDTVHTTGGCRDATCCSIVCAADPLCCEQSWSSTCVSYARTLCVPQPQWPCPCIGSCFEARDKAGCDDEVCCSGVCNIDPTCCTDAWDNGCVVIARTICDGEPECGSTQAGDCFEVHDAPFCNDSACCEAVCRFRPTCCSLSWDSKCVEIAQLTCGGGCGAPYAGNCFEEGTTAGCADELCCLTVCQQDELCCTTTWDSVCAEAAATLCKSIRPTCGDDGLPGCNQAHNGPACADLACCTAVCAADPLCCDVRWDADCVALVRTAGVACARYNFGCGDTCAGSCCEEHKSPNCDDAACCNIVKSLDAFCGNVEWDIECVRLARQYCGLCPSCGDAETGDCCVPHGPNQPYCNDETCCNTVCALDAYCCSVEWDITCANRARQVCVACNGGPTKCGDPLAGDCCTASTTRYCNDAECCNTVCIKDPACCDVRWDALCAQTAQEICTVCSNGFQGGPKSGEGKGGESGKSDGAAKANSEQSMAEQSMAEKSKAEKSKAEKSMAEPEEAADLEDAPKSAAPLSGGKPAAPPAKP